MRVWLYGRLSNDADILMHLIENQEKICWDFAHEQGYPIIIAMG